MLSFVRHDLPIDLPAIESFRRRGGGAEELDLLELVRTGRNSSAPPQTRNALRANLHFRLVEVVMMLLLPLLAVALAVPPKRSTSGLGIFLSIVMVVTYHKVNQYAEQWARRPVDPAIALGCRRAVRRPASGYWTAHSRAAAIGALERRRPDRGRVRKLFAGRPPAPHWHDQPAILSLAAGRL